MGYNGPHKKGLPRLQARCKSLRLSDDEPHELGILRDEVRHTTLAQPVSLLVEVRLDLPLSPSLGANLFPQLGP